MNTSHSMEETSNQAKEQTNAITEISKVGVTAITITAGIIGCWATACLFAGTISSGGPFELVSNLFKAIIG